MAWVSWVVVLGLVVFLAVSARLVLRRGWGDRRGKGSNDTPVVLARFWATGAIVAFSIGGAGHVLNALTSPEVTLSGVPLGNYWPTLPSGMVEFFVGEGDERLVFGAIHSGDLVVSGLGVGARLLLAGGELLIGAACVAVAVLIRRACTAILGGRAFEPRLRLWAWWTAIVVLVAGFGGQLLKFIGQSQAANVAMPRWSIDPSASEELQTLLEGGESTVDGVTIFSGATPTAPSFGSQLDSLSLTPLWVAIIIIVVVELLNAGVRLATQNARLAKDVEGLV
jgi:hypothetical protein